MPLPTQLNEAALGDLMARVQRETDEGNLPSSQLAFAHDGEVVFETAIGDATVDSRYTIFSSTKPVVAGGVWILMGEGLLDVEKPVAHYIPEFGANGKDEITVEQVMLHTSGFPRAPFHALDWEDRDTRLARFANWRTNWEPGTRFEYHPTSAHWVLAELIERASGTDFRVFLRTRILDPLGLDRLQIGVPVDEQGDILDLVCTNDHATPDELEAVIGIRELPLTEVTPESLMSLNAPAARTVGVPGGGGVSTAAQLALYYQGVLHNQNSIWKPEVLADVTTTVRNTMPDFLGTPANRTRGLVLAGDKGHLRGMGRTASPRTFGHNGAGGQIAWADPETGFSFAYLTNGYDLHEIRQWRRTSAIGSRAGNVTKP